MSIYRERLWPTPWIFVASALVIPASLLVFLPIDTTAGVIVAIVLYLGVVGLLLGASLPVEVTDGHLRVGSARLPVEFVGEAEAFRGAEASLERGQRADARAWMGIRGWIGPIVKVQNTDAEDPVPYWIVSTRRPEALIEALRSARAAANPPA
ncbi:DUF3093 domain-containing protein [Arenivirga flava]|uniref:DUF3093 domain-containing protein n=1 Tax=Arenivirga flava TaxID=1930060 RepID=A0AA37X8J0_9MICO|nr:DUF3093 domain-containing protein [Arenivirga flava]GMA27659.1 hypothetical protein GCM10025874_09120 [Arenivirga flava]